MKNGWRQHSKKPNVATVWTCQPVCSTCVYSGHFSSAVSVFFVSFPLVWVSWTNLVDDSGKKSRTRLALPRYLAPNLSTNDFTRNSLFSGSKPFLFCSPKLCLFGCRNEWESFPQVNGKSFQVPAETKKWRKYDSLFFFDRKVCHKVSCPPSFFPTFLAEQLLIGTRG